VSRGIGANAYSTAGCGSRFESGQDIRAGVGIAEAGIEGGLLQPVRNIVGTLSILTHIFKRLK